MLYHVSLSLKVSFTVRCLVLCPPPEQGYKLCQQRESVMRWWLPSSWQISLKRFPLPSSCWKMESVSWESWLCGSLLLVNFCFLLGHSLCYDTCQYTTHTQTVITGVGALLGSFLKEDPDMKPNSWQYCLSTGIDGVAAGALLVMISNAMYVAHHLVQHWTCIKIIILYQQVARSLQGWRRVVWHGGIVWVSDVVFICLLACCLISNLLSFSFSLSFSLIHTKDV